MINLVIDGRQVSVPKGTTVYTAARQLGIDIPIFCYHDRMPPFGACRMCLVEVEKMPKLQTSCTLEVYEGMVVHTQSKNSTEGREGILELLLINHPLDCPICDKGGECPLQDQTLKFGPGLSRFFEEKRRFKKPLHLGPVLSLDRERCVVCARCTRFGDLVAGDHALEFFDRGYKTEVGTPDGGPAQSKFIGNTIAICPVGALTSRVYRFRARPWDNDSTNTTCSLCPVGCNMILDARDGEIMRTRACEDRNVNDIWLCDKGWFGYEFTTHTERLQTPLVRHNGKLEPASWESALSLVASKMQEAQPSGKLAGFGGNPLTVEENFLFQKLMRTGAGVNHVDHRLGMPLFTVEEEGIAPGMEMSIGACEELSYAFLLGVDLTEEFPVIWLRLRQAINRGAEVVFCGPFAPEIALHLSKTILHAPGNELKIIQQCMPQIASLASKGKPGALFVGRQYLHTPQRRAILSALSQLQRSTQNLTLNILEGKGNSLGARLAGMRPDMGPLSTPLTQPGLNSLQVMEESARHGWEFLYVAGANPATQLPSKLWQDARKKLKFLVVQDLFLTETAQQADLVLPALSFVEKAGTFVNIERRVRKLSPGKESPAGPCSDEEIFKRLAKKLHFDLSIDANFLEKFAHEFAPKPESKLAEMRQGEQKSSQSGLTAVFAPALFDRGVRMQHNPHLIQLAKEPCARVHPEEGARRGIHDHETVRVSMGGNSITINIELDPGVAKGTVVLPIGFPTCNIYDLNAQLFNGMPIELVCV